MVGHAQSELKASGPPDPNPIELKGETIITVEGSNVVITNYDMIEEIPLGDISNYTLSSETYLYLRLDYEGDVSLKQIQCEGKLAIRGKEGATLRINNADEAGIKVGSLDIQEKIKVVVEASGQSEGVEVLQGLTVDKGTLEVTGYNLGLSVGAGIKVSNEGFLKGTAVRDMSTRVGISYERVGIITEGTIWVLSGGAIEGTGYYSGILVDNGSITVDGEGSTIKGTKRESSLSGYSAVSASVVLARNKGMIHEVYEDAGLDLGGLYEPLSGSAIEKSVKSFRNYEFGLEDGLSWGGNWTLKASQNISAITAKRTKNISDEKVRVEDEGTHYMELNGCNVSTGEMKRIKYGYVCIQVEYPEYPIEENVLTGENNWGDPYNWSPPDIDPSAVEYFDLAPGSPSASGTLNADEVIVVFLYREK